MTIAGALMTGGPWLARFGLAAVLLLAGAAAGAKVYDAVWVDPIRADRDAARERAAALKKDLAQLEAAVDRQNAAVRSLKDRCAVVSAEADAAAEAAAAAARPDPDAPLPETPEEWERWLRQTPF